MSPDSTVWIDVRVGSDSAQVDSLFGTSFTLEYDASRVSVTGDEAGPFLGSDVVYQSHVDSAAGEIGIGVSRKSGTGGVSESGVVARVKVSVSDTVSGGTQLPFAPSEVTANDPGGATISLDPGSLAVTVQSTGERAPPIRPDGPETVSADSTFWVDIVVGNGSRPADSLFGTSFTLEYDASRVSITDDEAGSFLGGDVVYQSSTNEGAGEIGIGVSRKSGAGGVAGSGAVARVQVQVADTASGGAELPFQLSEVTANGPDGSHLQLSPEPLTVALEGEADDPPPIRPAAPARAGTSNAFWIDVVVGAKQIPAENLFGTSFTLGYDESRVSVVRDQAGSFLGSDVVYQSNVDETRGTVGIGVSRKSGAGGVDGSGTVARIRVRVADTVSGEAELSFTVSDVTANRPDGSPLPLEPHSLTVSIPTIQSKVVGGNGTVAFDSTGASMAFSGVAGEDTVSVERYSDAPSGTEGIDESTVSDYRLVIEAGNNLQFDSSEVRLPVSDFEGISDPDDVTVYKRDTPGEGAFAALNTRVGDNDTPGIVSDDTLYATAESFSEFALASNTNSLPVELADLQATTSEKSVVLTWRTASETSNAGFEVQRREAAASGGHPTARPHSWTQIGFVESKAEGGTTTETTKYRFGTGKLEVGSHQFRLRQVDVDGTEHFSDPITVQVRMKAAYRLSAFPNPTRRQATVKLAVREKQEVRLVLYDVLGRRVATLHDGPLPAQETKTLTLDAERRGMASGTYFLRLVGEEGTKTNQLTIVQ